MADKNDEELTLPGLSPQEINDLIKAANAGDPKAQAYCARHTALFERLSAKVREEIALDFVLTGYERMEAATRELHLSIGDLKKRLGLVGISRAPLPQPKPPAHKVDKKAVATQQFFKPARFELKKPPVKSMTEKRIDNLIERLLTAPVIVQQEQQDIHDIADRHIGMAPPEPEPLNRAVEDIDQMVEPQEEGLHPDPAPHPRFPGEE